MSFKISINEVDYSANALLPFKWSGLLDERLDEARISLKGTSVPTFTPQTPVTVTLSVGDEAPLVLDYVISADEATEIIQGSGKFDHELTLIEPTKILEGIAGDTTVYQNNLGRTYASNPIKAEPIYE